MKIRVLLRNSGTGEYFVGPDEWDGNVLCAQQFSTVQTAVRWARLQLLSGLEVVLTEDDPRHELVLPVPVMDAPFQGEPLELPLRSA